MLVILTLGRLKWENTNKFDASLGYRVSSRQSKLHNENLSQKNPQDDDDDDDDDNDDSSFKVREGKGIVMVQT